jgi:hypothetical protein
MTKYSIQINVPHSEYGACDYFMPKVLADWLKEYGLKYSYAGGGSWGDGYTNGITNKESTYIVRNAKEEDGLAFKINFPKCHVFISEQYEYA